MTVGATAREMVRRASLPARLVIGGLAGVTAGAAAQGAAGTLNVNGVAGGWPVLVVGAGLCASLLAARARPAAERWRDVPIGLALGLLVVGLLDLAELMRGIDEAAAGGLLGMIGRVVAAGSAVMLVAGLFSQQRAAGDAAWLRRLRATPRYHLSRVGGVVVVIGWLLLVTAGQGFAVRTVDALGIVGATLIAVSLGMPPSVDAADRPGRAALAALAAGTAMIGIDTLLAVLGHVGSIWDDGLATAGGYALYLVGVVIVGLGAIHATIGLRRPSRAVAAEG